MPNYPLYVILNSKYVNFFLLLITVSLSFSTTSCESSSENNDRFLPSSAGQPDEILWVMNEKFLDDTIGSTIYHRFAKSYDVLPQAEPNYALRQKSFQQFNNDIIKKYRTIVICASEEEDADKIELIKSIAQKKGIEFKDKLILKNVWANPQLVVLITAKNNEKLLQNLIANGDEIETAIRKSEDISIDKLIFRDERNHDAKKVVKDNFGFNIEIPIDYYIAKNESDFVWLRKETYVLSSNLLFYKKKLSAEELNSGIDWNQYAIQTREEVTKTYISSQVEGSYMEIEDRFAPVFQDSTEILGHTAIETKGLWRIEGDFMGGPFRTITWLDQTTATYYMLDVFVHAPKEGKKKYMRHLESIIATVN